MRKYLERKKMMKYKRPSEDRDRSPSLENTFDNSQTLKQKFDSLMRSESQKKMEEQLDNLNNEIERIDAMYNRNNKNRDRFGQYFNDFEK